MIPFLFIKSDRSRAWVYFQIKQTPARSRTGFNVPNGRTSYPYEARHMPWYYDLNNLPEDEQFYFQRANKYISTFYSGILS